MNDFSKVWTMIIGLHIFFSISSSLLAYNSQVLQLYRSDMIEGFNGAPAKYLEAAVPADFSSGDLLTVKIVFVSANNKSNVLGSVEQVYIIRQTFVQDSYTTRYTLSKKASLAYIGKPGIPGLVDNMIVKNTRSFQFVMNSSVVDDLGLNYSNSVGDIVQFPLSYAGLDQDADASAQAKDGPSTSQIYDRLLSDNTEKTTSSQENNTPAKGIFDLDFEVDIDALVNKRDYDVFVLNTSKPAERNGHLVQVGYYIPTHLKEGSVLRVLALKKNARTGALLGSVEFNYYVDEIIMDNGLRIYMLTDMASISTKTGELVELYPVEKEAFTEAFSISVLEKGGMKILGIQHGDGGSAAVYEGTFSF